MNNSSPQPAHLDVGRFPSFGVLFKQAWKGFAGNFGKIVVIEVGFAAAALFLQYLFFGTIALSAFAEALRTGRLAGNPSGGAYSLIFEPAASLMVMVPALILFLFLEVAHQGALFALATAGTSPRARLGYVLKQGIKVVVRIAFLLLCLFVAGALLNAILALIAAFITRYTGEGDVTTIAMMNRIFLLLLALGLLFMFVIYALSGLHLLATRVSAVRALKAGFALWRRVWWRISSRAFLAALIVYVVYEVAGKITFSLGNVNARSIVSVFFVPFALFFMHEVYKAATVFHHHTT